MQPIVFDFKGRPLKAFVRALSVVDLSVDGTGAGNQASMGILTAQTDVIVRKDEGSKIKIKASGKK